MNFIALTAHSVNSSHISLPTWFTALTDVPEWDAFQVCQVTRSQRHRTPAYTCMMNVVDYCGTIRICRLQTAENSMTENFKFISFNCI